MADEARLHDEDFYAWTRDQAAALRAAARTGSNLPLDYGNLAEEIEDLGDSRRRELRSRLLTVLEHLLKLEHAPAQDPRTGWHGTIGRSRVEIEGILEDSPSLHGEVAGQIAWGLPRAVRLVADELRRRGELTPEVQSRLAAATYTEEQALGDWFPPPPAGA